MVRRADAASPLPRVYRSLITNRILSWADEPNPRGATPKCSHENTATIPVADGPNPNSPYKTSQRVAQKVATTKLVLSISLSQQETTVRSSRQTLTRVASAAVASLVIVAPISTVSNADALSPTPFPGQTAPTKLRRTNPCGNAVERHHTFQHKRAPASSQVRNEAGA